MYFCRSNVICAAKNNTIPFTPRQLMPIKTTSLLLAILLLQAFQSVAQDSTQFVAPTAGNLSSTGAPSDTSGKVLSNLIQQIKKPIQPQKISLRSVVVPAALISYGAVTFSSKELQNLNHTVWEELGGNATRKHIGFDSYAKYLPAVAVYGLNLAGVKGRHNLVDRTMLYGMANVIGGGITASAKRLAMVQRPDSSDRFSFPSGHATGAFIAAEFLRQEYKEVSPWYGVAGYAVAAGTGALRMYNNKHWLNDVVAGAGVGILSTRIAYWLYPVLKNVVFKNKNTQTLVIPIYQQGNIGLGMVHYF